MGIEDKIYRIAVKKHYRYVIADAHNIVKQAIEQFGDAVGVSVSGGKDSVAMCHIVAQRCSPFIIWNDSGLELPDSKDVVYALADKLNLKVLVAKGSALNRKIEIGKYQAVAEAKKTDRLCIREPVKKLIKKYNLKLNFVGLREKESKARRMMIRKNGTYFFNKTWDTGTAFPMRHWEGQDCLSYIEEHKLPLHPAYLRSFGEKNKSDIRVSWIWDSTRENCGDIEYMRKFYPEFYLKLKNIGVI